MLDAYPLPNINRKNNQVSSIMFGQPAQCLPPTQDEQGKTFYSVWGEWTTLLILPCLFWSY